MTQDQYGQEAGYGARDDETDEAKPMTRFQKVASALRGDRPDQDDEDQVPGGQADPDYGTAAGSEPATDRDTVTDPGATGYPAAGAEHGAVTDADRGAGTYPGTGAVADREADPGAVPDATTDPDGAAAGGWGTRSEQDATASANQRGDYWDVPDERGGQVAGVTHADTPVAETGTDPLLAQDETRPDIPEAQETPGTQPDAYAPGATAAGATAAGATAAGDRDAVAGDTMAGDTMAGDTMAGDVAGRDDLAGAGVAGDQTGAATISDVPVTQQDAEVAGRHAAGAPAEDLRPGEASGSGSLDDLGDLAYGKLLPDADHFTEQWQQIQFRFVDDPQASVTEAAEVVAQVTAKLEAAIQERQRAIAARQKEIQDRQASLRGRWSEGTQADTETLRETLRMYRAFLDQLIGKA